MILNVFTVTALFLAGVGLVLAALAGGAAAVALAARRRGSGSHPSDRADAFRDRAHLVGLLVFVLAGVRLLAWPHFYALLDSYVPALAVYGVMCAYGVTLIEAPLVTALEWTKPLLAFALALWALLALVDRRAGADGAGEDAPLAPARIALTLPVAALAAADCAIEIAYLLRDKAGRPVTCCTRFRDTDAARIAENLSPIAHLGSISPAWTVGALLATGLALAAAAMLVAKRRAAPGPVALAALAAGGAVNLVVTQWAWIDAVAPRVLDLPYHHCVYELITGTLDLGPAAFFALGGSAGLFLPLALHAVRRRAPDAVAAVQRGTCAACAIALATELLIVAVHTV